MAKPGGRSGVSDPGYISQDEPSIGTARSASTPYLCGVWFLHLFAAVPLPGIAAGFEDVSARERAAYGLLPVRWPFDGRGLRRAKPLQGRRVTGVWFL